jgi:hypothetical protein
VGPPPARKPPRTEGGRQVFDSQEPAKRFLDFENAPNVGYKGLRGIDRATGRMVCTAWEIGGGRFRVRVGELVVEADDLQAMLDVAASLTEGAV